MHAIRRDRVLAAAFVRDLPATAWDDLPRKVRELSGHRARVAAELRARLDGGPIDPEVRTRIALTLLPSDQSRAAELGRDRLLTCGPDEHRAIREAACGRIEPRSPAGSSPRWPPTRPTLAGAPGRRPP